LLTLVKHRLQIAFTNFHQLYQLYISRFYEKKVITIAIFNPYLCLCRKIYFFKIL